MERNEKKFEYFVFSVFWESELGENNILQHIYRITVGMYILETGIYLKQGKTMKYLTRQEEIYLLAIWRLQGDAYGVQIKKQVTEMTRKEPSYGALYFTLEQLFKKDFVDRTVGDPTPVRGGCSKIYYQLTPKGKEALKAAYELHHSIWDGVTVLNLRES